MAEIIEIDEFEAAFPVGPNARDEVMRRFSTLLLDTSQPRRYGSNGIVSKAQNVFGETFAIKRLRAGLEETPLPDIPPAKASSGAAAAFRKEYESQLVVSNMRGFPKLYGFGSFGDAHLIIMEWVEGTSLAEVFSRGSQLSPDVVMAIGAELFSILSNLDSLSSRPVHRDLSPSNIIVKTHERSLEEQLASKSLDICIIDFGSTTLIDEQNPSFTALTSILRHATPEYAPPEMLTETLPNILELRQSPAIDVYAVCSVLYEALSGHTPYRVSEHPREVPYLLKTTTAIPPLHVPGYEEACAMIMRGLSDDPAQRPSAAEMRDVLLRACGKASASSLSLDPQLAGSNPVAQEVLPMHQGNASVRDASFEHANDAGVSKGTQPATKKKAVSRRGFIALAGAAGLVAAGGGVAALLGGFGPEQQSVSSTSSSSPVASPYDEDMLLLVQDAESGLFGYINTKGEWVIPARFRTSPGPFVDGLAAAQNPETELWGYLNRSGEWAIDPVYLQTVMFGEGLTFVQASFDTKGAVIAPDGTPLGGWIDTEGNWAFEPKYWGGGIFSNGLVSFSSSEKDAGGLWGFLDKQGNVVIEEKFRTVGTFSDNGLALASIDNTSYGWVDSSGEWAIEPRYGDARDFSENLAACMNEATGRWGYIDSEGAKVLPFIYLQALDFINGLAAVFDSTTGLWGYIKQDGSWAIVPSFMTAGNFYHGLAPVVDVDTEQCGFIDDTGDWVIPPQYKDTYFNFIDYTDSETT